MKYICSICGIECKFEYEVDLSKEYFVVCEDCDNILDSGVWTEEDTTKGEQDANN